MARERVFAVTCDRQEHVADDKPRTFVARLGEVEVKYDDLCAECHKTLSGLLEEAGPLLKVSPKRTVRGPVKSQG